MSGTLTLLELDGGAGSSNDTRREYQTWQWKLHEDVD
jgi:hypothetical protein